MLDCVSVENMRLSDAYTIANFVSGTELMRRAAWGVFKATHWSGNTAIVVGSGNNGGDGFALAWILKEHGFDCTVFEVAQKRSDDGSYYAAKAAAIKGIKVISLVGQNQCLLDDLSCVTIHAPKTDTASVQELHLPIYHAICAELEKHFFE